MTIIAATDFSLPAAEAVSVAGEIAKQRGERLLLWHAVAPLVGEGAATYGEAIRADASKQLEQDAERLRVSGVDAASAVVIGDPDHQLPAVMPAETTMIVAGRRGHRRGTHWLLGSVTERLARVVTVPLLVVHDAATLREWLHGAGKLRVIAATDFSPASDFALRQASLLRDFGACDVELLYVAYPPARDRNPVDELARRAATIDLGGKVTTGIETTLGQTGTSIAVEAQEAKAGLVIVGTHQRTGLARIWHGSIAHAALHSVDTNILVIPAAEDEVRAREPAAVRTSAGDARP